MPKFHFEGQVRRDVEDIISLVVEASSEDEAYSKAHSVLEVYPERHTIEGVSFCYTENRRIVDSTVVSLTPTGKK